MSDAAPRLRVDFQNADTTGRVRLNTAGTAEDLSALSIQLCEGMIIYLVDDELSAMATVTWSSDEQLWVADVTGPS